MSKKFIPSIEFAQLGGVTDVLTVAKHNKKKVSIFLLLFTGHFEEKLMPSAGFVPYAQSLVCSFNNTCHKYEQQQNQFNGYNGSM